jgi:hypothetical protein
VMQLRGAAPGGNHGARTWSTTGRRRRNRSPSSRADLRLPVPEQEPFFPRPSPSAGAGTGALLLAPISVRWCQNRSRPWPSTGERPPLPSAGDTTMDGARWRSRAKAGSSGGAPSIDHGSARAVTSNPGAPAAPPLALLALPQLDPACPPHQALPIASSRSLVGGGGSPGFRWRCKKQGASASGGMGGRLLWWNGGGGRRWEIRGLTRRGMGG